MKYRFSWSVLLVAFALSPTRPTAFASAPETPSFAYTVKGVQLDQNGTTLLEGTSQMTVLRLLGASYRTLPDETWLYHGFTSPNPSAQEQSCDQLVIAFSRGKVTDLKLVNHEAARLIAKGVPVKLAGSVVAVR